MGTARSDDLRRRPPHTLELDVEEFGSIRQLDATRSESLGDDEQDVFAGGRDGQRVGAIATGLCVEDRTAVVTPTMSAQLRVAHPLAARTANGPGKQTTRGRELKRDRDRRCHTAKGNRLKCSPAPHDRRGEAVATGRERR